FLRHRAIAAIDDQYFVDGAAISRGGGIHRDRQQSLALRIGLDVEGQHPWRHLDVGRPQHRVVENPGDARAGHARTFDLAASLDVALYEVAHRETDVGLEGLDTRAMQPVAYARNILGSLGFDPRDGCAIERRAPARVSRGDARPVDVGSADIEVRPL